MRRVYVLGLTLFASDDALGIRVGGFVPANYIRQVVENSDFRTDDDGLRMILECTEELAARSPNASPKHTGAASCVMDCAGRTWR